ncbi:hypothetical protein QCA50_012476 [Cerrena zonata]|uniref:Uncharacterized protein n=1 Tax=Cerrena zonata TaxID=2478898 RepID=A0AAW0FZK9_9APHY
MRSQLISSPRSFENTSSLLLDTRRYDHTRLFFFPLFSDIDLVHPSTLRSLSPIIDIRSSVAVVIPRTLRPGFNRQTSWILTSSQLSSKYAQQSPRYVPMLISYL